MRKVTVIWKLFRFVMYLVAGAIYGLFAYGSYIFLAELSGFIRWGAIIIFAGFGLFLCILAVEKLFLPTVSLETKTERLDLERELKSEGYRKFDGQVKISTIHTVKYDDIVIGKKQPGDNSESHKECLEITFRSESEKVSFPLREEATSAYKNYLFWYFGGKYLMVCRCTEQGFGKPYIRA